LHGFRRLALTLFALQVSACEQFGRGECTDLLARMRQRSAVSEARGNVMQGDLRFLGVNGYTTMFPGLPDDRARGKMVSRHGYRTIEKTSDSIADESCGHYQHAAWRFAALYNKEVLDLTGTRF
jgi:hypothetical protein